jgi:hypothetical protein
MPAACRAGLSCPAACSAMVSSQPPMNFPPTKTCVAVTAQECASASQPGEMRAPQAGQAVNGGSAKRAERNLLSPLPAPARLRHAPAAMGVPHALLWSKPALTNMQRTPLAHLRHCPPARDGLQRVLQLGALRACGRSTGLVTTDSTRAQGTWDQGRRPSRSYSAVSGAHRAA